ncbi:MAG: glycosyltransferase [Tenuifilaceae bacterium]|jgi:cellulose synthase/poly-beta-1,6-N-acetylglucosamine synthase-like glycosyltransferase|nr:glycosyltransferase [Bacteroidales bacterium]MDI9515396.1 glycosyltransferase [Bacteroidota bacterium]NLH57248.1 glycosyltransferase [Rikenellaceae bacterium]OQC62860.1 MAG: Poly-beta-1,6-N-acetyl-D-glucosamine synthase [Bacteroidetes bacterium ADurb.Bin008]HNV81803.1 glycosyltransferase [Tenuifilaceae bacterium]
MALLWVFVVVLSTLYGAMVVSFIVGLLRFPRENGIPTRQPIPISVIAPIRNEEHNLDGLLGSLAAQDYPKDSFEVIMVNDHSTDSSRDRVNSWRTEMDNLHLVDLPLGTTGKKDAIAAGVERAKYDFIALTDADCSHPKSWLAAMAQGFGTEETKMVIGPVMIKYGKKFFQRMQALEHASLQAVTLGGCGLGIPFMAGSANLAFHRERVGFNREMLNPSHPSGDDVFLLHGAKRQGRGAIGCVHSPQAMVYTKPAEGLAEFLFQRARWASKAPLYRDVVAILVALIVLIFNLMLLLLVVLSFFIHGALLALATAIAVKALVDFPLLRIYLKRYKETSLLWVFIPLQLLYPFYIALAFALSVMAPVKWKKDSA